MIRKYLFSNNSLYRKSLSCLFYEGQIRINITQRFESDLSKLFNDFEDIKLNSFNNPYLKETISIEKCYIEEETNRINAIILHERHDNNYFFLMGDSVDSKKFLLKDKNHGSSDKIESDYEKNKLKKKYGGLGKAETFNDHVYLDIIKDGYDDRTNLDSNSDLIAYKFNKSKDNKFTTDFVQLFQNRIYCVVGDEYDEQWVGLNLDEMPKTRNNRFDLFFIDNSREVRYFVYSNIRHDVLHYYLFRNNGGRQYSFLLESISLKEIFRHEEISRLSFRYASEEECLSMSKIWFRDYVLAKEEEKEEDIQLEIQEQIEQDFEEFADGQIDDANKVFGDHEDIIKLIENFNGYVDKGLVMFKDFEDFPLAALSKDSIKIRATRYPNNYDHSTPLSIKPSQRRKIYSRLEKLLIETPSSRLMELEKLIDKAIEYEIKEDSYLADEIRYLHDSLLESDKNYPPNYYDSLVEKYKNHLNILLSDDKPAELPTSTPKEHKKDNIYSRYINKGRKLVIIGATIGRGTIDLIKKIAIKQYGFKKNDIQTYGFFVKGLDVNSLQNPRRRDDTILIVGASDHNIEGLSTSDHLKGAIENYPNNYPKTKFVTDSKKHLCNISASKVEALLEEFRREGLIN